MPSTHYGPFTEGVARLVQKGGLSLSRSDCEFTDKYTLVLPMGTRPAANQSGMPQIGDDSDDVADYAVDRIKWTQRGLDSKVWDADVVYRKGKSETAGDETYTDLEKTWGTRTVQQDFTQDAVSGEAVVNAAGDPFERVPQRELVCPSLSLRRVSSKDPSHYFGYQGSVNENEETVMGITFQPHCARITFEARELDGGKYEYMIRVDGAINMYAENATSGTVEDIGWDVSMLNCGYTYIDAHGDRRVAFIPDGNGKMVRPTEPQLLDLSGDLNPGGQYFLKFSPYPEKDWSSLHLPED